MERGTPKNIFIRFFPIIFTILISGFLTVLVIFKNYSPAVPIVPVGPNNSSTSNNNPTIVPVSSKPAPGSGGKTPISQNSNDPYSAGLLEINGQKINIDIASTPAERTQGLSGRPPLEKNQGLLFVFDKPDQYGFWMKDMRFSIDIIWIDAGKKIVHIEKSLSPETYPQVYTPADQALYVLEVPAGFSEEHTVKIGDEVIFFAQ